MPAQRSVGALIDGFPVGAGCEFHDAEGACLDVEDGQVGDEAVRDGLTGERNGAFADQPGTAVFGGVFRDEGDPLRAVDEVRGAAGPAPASTR